MVRPLQRGDADAIRELRQFTSPGLMRVDGTPLLDYIVGECENMVRCHTVQDPAAKWLGSIEAELRTGIGAELNTTDAAIIDAKLQDIKENFPSSAPYVLTHGELISDNIIVKDSKITAVIDWRLAGYYPWWVER
jgi:hypothetical protein